MREEFYAGLEDRKYVTLPVAQKKALKVDWSAPQNAPAKPRQLGTKTWLDFPIEELLPYIDWNPFFQASASCAAASSSHSNRVANAAAGFKYGGPMVAYTCTQPPKPLNVSHTRQPPRHDCFVPPCAAGVAASGALPQPRLSQDLQ
jgi:hypothetical protein